LSSGGPRPPRRRKIRLRGRSDRRFRDSGEATALQYLESHDHLLLRHNYHAGRAEIDLLTVDPEGRLHAVEVKRWSPTSLEAVHPLERWNDGRRRRSLLQAAQSFLAELQSEAEEARDLRRELKNRRAGFDPAACDVIFDLLLVAPDDSIELYADLFA